MVNTHTEFDTLSPSRLLFLVQSFAFPSFYWWIFAGLHFIAALNTILLGSSTTHLIVSFLRAQPKKFPFNGRSRSLHLSDLDGSTTLLSTQTVGRPTQHHDGLFLSSSVSSSGFSQQNQEKSMCTTTLGSRHQQGDKPRACTTRVDISDFL